jgi:type 1 glutamine amidotransferase
MQQSHHYLWKATLCLLTVMTFVSCAKGETQMNSDGELLDNDQSVLVFTKTSGFRHESIDAGIPAIEMLGEENGFNVVQTEDSERFNPEYLSNFDAVIFLNTTLTLFNEEQRNAFKGYIQNGGGFVGIHSASDTEYDWPWYGELVGAWFDNHPGNPNVRNAIVNVVNSDHLATKHLPETWQRDDEWYNFQEIPTHTNILLRLDTDSYEGSDHSGNHPISWYHEFDGGRAFYTGLGHTSESFSEDLFLDHLLGGIKYAMGE